VLPAGLARRTVRTGRGTANEAAEARRSRSTNSYTPMERQRLAHRAEYTVSRYWTRESALVCRASPRPFVTPLTRLASGLERRHQRSVSEPHGAWPRSRFAVCASHPSDPLAGNLGGRTCTTARSTAGALVADQCSRCRSRPSAITHINRARYTSGLLSVL
jgi:hypothetical protein